MAVYINGFSVWNAMVLFFHRLVRLENYLLGLMDAGFYPISGLCYVCSGLVCHTLSVVTFCLSLSHILPVVKFCLSLSEVDGTGLPTFFRLKN